jgi:hypothetical protein
MSEFFKVKQNARVDALKASREVLAERSSGPMSSNTKAVDTIDLINIASWIMNGKDPWKPKKENKGKRVIDDLRN